MFTVFQTKEAATAHAKSEYSALQLETQCVNVIKIGPSAARFYSCETGYAVDKDISNHE